MSSYRWPKWENAYLRLQRCRLPAVLYFLTGNLIDVISQKLSWFFFSVWRIFCKNFRQQGWLVFFRKNKIGAEILKHCNGDAHFPTLAIDMLLNIWSTICWSTNCYCIASICLTICEPYAAQHMAHHTSVNWRLAYC